MLVAMAKQMVEPTKRPRAASLPERGLWVRGMDTRSIPANVNAENAGSVYGETSAPGDGERMYRKQESPENAGERERRRVRLM